MTPKRLFNPNIQTQILQTDLHTFLQRYWLREFVKRNLFVVDPQHFDNVMTSFIINKRTDDKKLSGVNLFFTM